VVEGPAAIAGAQVREIACATEERSTVTIALRETVALPPMSSLDFERGDPDGQHPHVGSCDERFTEKIPVMATSVRQSVRIRAKPNVVWATLVDPAKMLQWMGGAHVESTWQPGDAISFTGPFHDRAFQDRGTVLACDPERLLRGGGHEHGAGRLGTPRCSG
jgi:Activator of Hsp90 ATPase homolog 1-like protein